MNCVAARQSAARMLRDKAETLRRQAHQVEALAFAAEHMSQEADEALWAIVCGHIRP